MSWRQFEIVAVDDIGIHVLDVRSGHEFGFEIYYAEDGTREIASQVTYWLNSSTNMDYLSIGQLARAFAKSELERRGLIDRCA